MFINNNFINIINKLKLKLHIFFSYKIKIGKY